MMYFLGNPSSALFWLYHVVSSYNRPLVVQPTWNDDDFGVRGEEGWVDFWLWNEFAWFCLVVVWRNIPLSKRLVTLVTLGKPLNGVILYISVSCWCQETHDYGTSPPFLGKSRNSMNLNGQCSSILPEAFLWVTCHRQMSGPFQQHLGSDSLMGSLMGIISSSNVANPIGYLHANTYITYNIIYIYIYIYIFYVYYIYTLYIYITHTWEV